MVNNKPILGNRQCAYTSSVSDELFSTTLLIYTFTSILNSKSSPNKTSFYDTAPVIYERLPIPFQMWFVSSLLIIVSSITTTNGGFSVHRSSIMPNISAIFGIDARIPSVIKNSL